MILNISNIKNFIKKISKETYFSFRPPEFQSLLAYQNKILQVLVSLFPSSSDRTAQPLQWWSNSQHSLRIRAQNIHCFSKSSHVHEIFDFGIPKLFRQNIYYDVSCLTIHQPNMFLLKCLTRMVITIVYEFCASVHRSIFSQRDHSDFLRSQQYLNSHFLEV